MTRTPTIVLAWLVAVVGATVIGLLAVGAIGDGIVGSGPRPLSATEVSALLASTAPTAPAPTVSDPPVPAPPVPAPPVPAPPVDPPPPPTVTGVLTSAGGTVVARCSGNTVEIVSASPAQGYRLHGESGEDPGRVRFDSGGGGRVEMQLTCSGGRPVSQVRGNG